MVLTGETRLTGTAFRTPSGEPELPSVLRAGGPTPRCAPPTERCPHARAGPGPPWPGGSRPPGRAPRSPSPTERRILEAIWERTYPSPVPWTIRGVARELGLHPMQVSRVCKRHHLSGPALRDVPPDGPFSVTVAGLYLRPPVIAAVFHRGARASEPGTSSTGRDTPVRGETSVTGGEPLFRLPIGERMAELMDLVRGSVDLVAPAQVNRWAVSDLLIFLREVESKNHPNVGSLCAVVGCPDPPGVGRVQRWVESRPHIQLLHHATTVEWLSAMDHFCDSQAPAPVLRPTVSSLENAATAMTLWAARSSRRPIGWAWSAQTASIGPGVGRGPLSCPIRLV